MSLDCNPYTATNITAICTVETPFGIDLKVQWFFSSSNNATLISSGDTQHFIQETKTYKETTIEIQSQLFMVSSLLVAGHYWCQVFYQGNGLLESDSLQISAEDDYAREDPCSVPQAIEKTKCHNIIENGASYSTCPSSSTTYSFTHSSIQTHTTSNVQTTSMSLMPPAIITLSTVTPSVVQISFTTEPVTHTITELSLPGTIPTNSPLGLQEMPTDTFHLWLYIVAGLTGIFGLLIIVLSVVCIVLCLTKPQKRSRVRRRK